MAGAAVDLVEQLPVADRRGRRSAEPPEQRGLAVVQREAVVGDQHAGRIVPSIEPDEDAEGVIAARDAPQTVE